MNKFYFAVYFLYALLMFSCGGEDVGSGSAETSPSKDKGLQEYNLDIKKEQSGNRNPCDTLSFQEYIISQVEAGTYLVEFDKTFTYTIPKPAVLYYNEKGKQYIFAAMARSKTGERFVETKNLVGYESSFVNLDSTKLGTAFFFLALYECDGDGAFKKIWESEIPIHGGFNSMLMKSWKRKKTRTLYVELNFEAGIISGHRNYNYFLVDGLTNPPHLMETYEALVHKRDLMDVNNDKYPDYMEYKIDDYTLAIKDSIPFYWDTLKTLYVTKRNKRWWRKY